MDSYLDRKMQVLNAARSNNSSNAMYPGSGGMAGYSDQGSHVPQPRYNPNANQGYASMPNQSHIPKPAPSGYGGSTNGGSGHPVHAGQMQVQSQGQMQGQMPHYGQPQHYSQSQPPMAHYPPPGSASSSNAGNTNGNMNPDYYRERSMPPQDHHAMGSAPGRPGRPSITLEQRIATLEDHVFALRQQNQLLMKYMNTSDAKIVELHNELAKAQSRCDTLETALRQRPVAAEPSPTSSIAPERRIPSAGRRAGQIPSRTVLTYDNLDHAQEPAYEEPEVNEPPVRSAPSRSVPARQTPKPEWQSTDAETSNSDGFGAPPPLPAAKKNLLLRTNKLRQAQVRQTDNAPPPSSIPQPSTAQRIGSAGSAAGASTGSGSISSRSNGAVSRQTTGGSVSHAVTASTSTMRPQMELKSETAYSRFATNADEDNDDDYRGSGYHTDTRGGHDVADYGHDDDADHDYADNSKGRRSSVDVTELDPFGGPEEELEPCPECGRRMRSQALANHIRLKICTKVRKQFDVKKMRLQGVVSETELKSLQRKEAQTTNAATNKKSTWKQQHEQFIESIRYGKIVSQAQKDGVDLRTLPPPPKNEALDDRVTCPYCERKFAQLVADRHIPHCKNARSRAPPPPRRR